MQTIKIAIGKLAIVKYDLKPHKIAGMVMYNAYRVWKARTGRSTFYA